MLAERVERLGDAARAEARQSARHLRPAEWAVAVVVATTTIIALAMAIARRLPDRTPIRAGGVAPARAPPLALSST